MEPFKNLFNKDSVKLLSSSIARENKNFDQLQFNKNVLKEISNLELKDRVRLIANCFHESSNQQYTENLKTITSCIINYNLSGFQLWPFSQYVESFGLKQSKVLQKSFKVLELITEKFTSEFAIRDYINTYPTQSFSFLEKCSKSKNEHLRRFASEGSRPSLPWGKKITDINQLKIFSSQVLESLKNDQSEYVRKSVANHINDYNHIDHSFSLDILEKWSNEGVNQKLIRHALRTLLKNGNPRALKIMGYRAPKDISAAITSLGAKTIIDGQSVGMKIEITNLGTRDQNALIDYIIHYPKKNGKYTTKVFRLKDTVLKAKSKLHIDKIISFKVVTVRSHHPGKYFIELQINGKLFNKKSFILNEKN